MTTALHGCVDAGILLDDYLDHVTGLKLSGRAIRDRTRIARGFLSCNPDLTAWTALPARERAAQLRASGAWPLLCYAVGTGRLKLDVELAAIKQLSGLGAAVEARDAAGFAALRQAGNPSSPPNAWCHYRRPRSPPSMNGSPNAGAPAIAPPTHGVLTDFLFTRRGRRLGYTRLRNGLLAAAQSAGLRAPDGTALIVTPHQLRHTWATELAMPA